MNVLVCMCEYARPTAAINAEKCYGMYVMQKKNGKMAKQ